MAQIRKIPMRQCTGCRQMFEKRSLLRIVRTPSGEIALDSKGKLPGRGAYICKNPECFRKSKKTGSLERAFGCPVPDEIYEGLLLRLVDEDG